MKTLETYTNSRLPEGSYKEVGRYEEMLTQPLGLGGLLHGAQHTHHLIPQSRCPGVEKILCVYTLTVRSPDCKCSTCLSWRRFTSEQAQIFLTKNYMKTEPEKNSCMVTFNIMTGLCLMGFLGKCPSRPQIQRGTPENYHNVEGLPPRTVALPGYPAQPHPHA